MEHKWSGNSFTLTVERKIKTSEMKELLMEKEINSLRGFSFVFGVLLYLQGDPLCSKCRLFVRSVDAAKDKFLALEKLINRKNMSEEMRRMLLGIYTAFANLEIPDNPVRQREAGNCKLPKGACLPDSVLTIYERIVD